MPKPMCVVPDRELCTYRKLSIYIILSLSLSHTHTHTHAHTLIFSKNFTKLGFVQLSKS